MFQVHTHRHTLRCSLVHKQQNHRGNDVDNQANQRDEIGGQPQRHKLNKPFPEVLDNFEQGC